MKKLNAVVDAAGDEWIVTVTEIDTGIEHRVTVKAATEKEAAFKAMEQIND